MDPRLRTINTVWLLMIILAPFMLVFRLYRFRRREPEAR